MHHKAFGGRALPGPAAGGAHSALPDPLAGFRGSVPRGEERRVGRGRKQIAANADPVRSSSTCLLKNVYLNVFTFIKFDAS